MEQEHWLRKLADDFSVSEAVLREIMPVKSQPKKVVTISPVRKVVTEDKDLRIVKRVLAILMIYPQYFSEVLSNLNVEYLENENTISLYKKIVLFYTKNTGSVDNLAGDKSDDKDFFDLLHNWLRQEQFDQDLEQINEIYLLGQKEFLNLEDNQIKQEISGLVKILKDDYLNKKIDKLKNKLTELEKSGASSQEINVVYKDLSEMIREKNY